MRWKAGLCILLLAGCAQPLPGPLAASAEAPIPAGSYLHAWTTHAEGPLVHVLQFEAGGGWCATSLAATGSAPDFSATMLAMVEDGGMFWRVGGGQQDLVDPHARAQAQGMEHHAGPARAWADHLEFNRTWEAGQNVTITLAGVHLDGAAAPFWAHEVLDGAAAAMRIVCENPLRKLRTFDGTDVVIFSETTFTGGASAHVHVLGETGAQVANKVTLTTHETRGRLYLDHRGDLLLQHVAAGAITIRSPHGEQVILDHPAALALAIAGVIPLQYEVDAGPGTYEVELNYASVDILGDVQGFLLGTPW